MKLLFKNKKRLLDKSLNKPFSKGFTLIELLVVMAILASLSAIGFGVYMKTMSSTKEKETKVIIEAVATAMESRSSLITAEQRASASLNISSSQIFPSGSGAGSASTDVLVDYISGDFDGDGTIDTGVTSVISQIIPGQYGKSSYIMSVAGNDVIVDAWGTPLRYRFPGVYHNQDNGFDIESAGPDKEFGSGSDEESRDNIILK